MIEQAIEGLLLLVHAERIEKHISEDEEESRDYIRQAWAEEMELYRRSHHELKLSKHTEEYLKEMQKEFMSEDSKVGMIQLWLDNLCGDYVCSLQIYKEDFQHKYDTPKDWELKEINNIMNNRIIGWEKISTHRFKNYGIQRGWHRKTDEKGFRKVEEKEVPFK